MALFATEFSRRYPESNVTANVLYPAIWLRSVRDLPALQACPYRMDYPRVPKV